MIHRQTFRLLAIPALLLGTPLFAATSNPLDTFADVDAWEHQARRETTESLTPDTDNAEALLRHAHALRTAGDPEAAARIYAGVAEDNALPAHVRGLARLYEGETWFAAGDEVRGRAACDAVAAIPDVPAHFIGDASRLVADMDLVARGLPVWHLERTRTPEITLPEPGAAVFVAPDGDDGNDGSKASPLATLEGARDAMRTLRREGAAGVTAYIRGGEYRRTGAFRLGPEDSGTGDAPTVFRAYPGETPRFTGGMRVEGFVPVSDADMLARIPEEAREHVVELDLGALGVTALPPLTQRGMSMAGKPLLELYYDGAPMRVARWPNEGFVYTGAVAETEDDTSGHVFGYEGDRPLRWTQARDVWMFGYWYHHWADCTLDAVAFDTDKRLVHTGLRSPYDVREGQHYYFFNLLEELDAPGEWYLDRASDMLYFYPPGPLDAATVELSLCAEPMILLDEARHVTLAGLHLDVSGDMGVRIQGGEGCRLLGCVLSRLGNDAVHIVGGHGHHVLGCDMHTLARKGIHALCGDRPSLTSGELVIENNHIHDFSRIDRSYTPAVYLDGVGARVAHNLFHNSPHHAMRIEGNDHEIVFNEIHSVVYESDDQSGLDMWLDVSYQGVDISYNFWHHIGSPLERHGQAGIRLDDAISNIRMVGNVFYRASGGIFGAIQIHGGKDNIIDNNLFIRCKYAVSFSAWGEKRWQEMLVSELMLNRIRGRVDIGSPPYSTRYPWLARLEEHADRNMIWRNLLVDCGAFLFRAPRGQLLADNVALATDPGFADPGAFNFALEENNPVHHLGGFRPIPFSLMGLYPDTWRATWPVEHRISENYAEEAF